MPLRSIGALTNSEVNTPTITLEKPVSPVLVEGDWMFAVIGAPANFPTHSIAPDDAAWVLVEDLQSSTTTATLAHVFIYKKKVTAGEANSSAQQWTWTVTGGTGRTFYAKIYAYSDLDGTDPIDDSAMDADGAAADLTIPCPSVTTTGADREIIRLPVTRETAAFPQLTGYTERDEVSATGHCWSWQDAVQASAGASGVETVTATGTAGEHVGVTLALKPAAAGPEAPTEDLIPIANMSTLVGLTNGTVVGDFPRIQDDPAAPDANWLLGTDPSGVAGNPGSSITHEGGADNGGNPTTSTTVVIPATVNNGDIITVSAVNAGATAQGTISDNSGVGNWTDNTNGGVVRTQAGTAMAGTVWWKRITNQTAERGATISIGGMTDSTCANLGIHRGCVSSGSPIDGTPVSENNASGNNTQAGITTLTDGAEVCLSVFFSDNTAVTSGFTATSPATLVKRSVDVRSSGGGDSALVNASEIKATAGATGAISWTPGTAQISVSIAFALKPNVGTADTPGSTVPTEVIVPLSDPSAETPDAAADGTLKMYVRKKGNGVTGGNPTVIGELREGTTVRGQITSQAVSSTTGHLFSVLVDQSTITDWTNLNFRMRSDGVSGALVELGAARYVMTGEEAGDTTPPAAPTGLVATDGTGQVSLDWTTHPDPDGDLAGYNVYRATSSGGTPTKINGSLVTFSDYVDTVGAGTYFYKVTAVDTSNNESGFSNEDSGVSSGATATATLQRVGAVTDDGFTAAMKVNPVGATVALRVSVNSDLSSPVGDFTAGTGPDAQGYVKRVASGLDPNTTYFWGWVLDGSLFSATGGSQGDGARGQVQTLPTPGTATSFVVAAASCSDHISSSENNGPVFTRIVSDGVRYFFHMGDMYYDDPNTSDAAVYRGRWDRQGGYSNQRQLNSKIPYGYIYSDHDFSGNNSSGDTGGTNSAGADTAPVVYRQIFPHHAHLADYDNPGGGTRSDNAIDYVTQIGRVHFFHMDTRSESTDREGADTSLAKTKLGSAQRTRLKNWLNHSSRKTMPKVILTQEVFCDDEGTLNGDGWHQYDFERQDLMTYIATNSITNIVFVGGDMHALAYKLDSAVVDNWPVYQSSPLGNGTSIKGAPGDDPAFYDDIYPADPATFSGNAHQYGQLAFTDAGGNSITMVFTGKNEDGTTLLTAPTHTFTNLVASTRITKDLNLSWKVAQRITKDLNLPWKVSSRVTKDLNLMWAVAAPTSRITKDLELRWSVKTTKDTDLRLTWPTPPQELVPGADLQNFHIEVRKVGSGVNPRLTAYLYENGSQIATGGVMRLNVPFSDPVGETFIASFDAANLSDITGAGVELRVLLTGENDGYGELVDVEWNALHAGTPSTRINKDLNLQWKVSQRVTKDLTLQWGVASRVTKDLNLPWRVAARVSKDIQLRWGIASRVTRDLNLPWKVATRVSKDLNLQWNVAGISATRITKDLNLSWKVATRVNKDLTLQWRTALRLTKDLNLPWRVQQRITKDLNLPWRVAFRVTKDLNAPWRVSSRITKDINLRWSVADVPGRISKDLQLSWRVRQRVTKDLQLRWGIATRVTKDLRLDWRVAERKTKDLTLQWRVATRVSKDLNLQWHVDGVVLNRITKDLNLRWTVITRVSKDLVLKWEVDSEELVVIVKGQVAPKIKVSGQVAPKITASWRVAPKLRVAGQVKEKIHVSGHAQ